MSDSDDEPLTFRAAKSGAADTKEDAPPASNNAVVVKKEEPAPVVDDDDDDDDKPLALARKSKQSVKPDIKPKTEAPAAKAQADKVKKEESESKQEEAATKQEEAAAKKQEAAVKKEAAAAAKKEEAAAKKEEAAGKKGKADAAKVTAAKKEVEAKEAEIKAKREKKEYPNIGQTRDTPPETDPLRKFYTSLLSQRPDSEMAKKWCLQCGLLDQSEAEKVIRQLGRSPAKPAARAGAKTQTAKDNPAKRPAPKRKSEDAKTTPRTKLKYEEFSDEDDDKPAKRGNARGNKKAESSDEDDSDDDRPLGAMLKKRPAVTKTRRTKDEAFTDGGLGDDDSDEDQPLSKRRVKK